MASGKSLELAAIQPPEPDVIWEHQSPDNRETRRHGVRYGRLHALPKKVKKLKGWNIGWFNKPYVKEKKKKSG